MTISITVQTVCFCIQVASIFGNVHLYHKNTAAYLRWNDRKFLHLRKWNVAWIVWATFWMAWYVYQIAKYVGVIA